MEEDKNLARLHWLFSHMMSRGDSYEDFTGTIDANIARARQINAEKIREKYEREEIETAQSVAHNGGDSR